MIIAFPEWLQFHSSRSTGWQLQRNVSAKGAIHTKLINYYVFTIRYFPKAKYDLANDLQ
jgi:hypothetical protein